MLALGASWAKTEILAFKEYLHTHVDQAQFPCTEYSDGSAFFANKQMSDKDSLDLISTLIKLNEKQSDPALEKLYKKQQELLVKTGTAYKHKNNFIPDVATETKNISEEQRHTTHIKQKEGESYVIKNSFRIERSELDEFMAFFSQLGKYALGKEHVANTRCMVDEANIPIATRQKEIKGLKSFNQLNEDAKTDPSKLPSAEQLIKGGVVEAMAAAYLFADTDMHLRNICLDENGNVVLFDFDQWFFPITCILHGYEPDKKSIRKFKDGHEEYEIEYPEPNKSFPITDYDLRFFPDIDDAQPKAWLLEGQEPLVEELRKLKVLPEVRKRTFTFFLRVLLLERDTVERFALAHITNSQSRKKLVDFLMARLDTLKSKLLAQDEFKCFLHDNKHNVIAELEKYNSSFKDKADNSNFKVNIEKAKATLEKDYTVTEEKAKEILNSNIKKLESQLNILCADLTNFNEAERYFITNEIDLSKVKEDLANIKIHREKWPSSDCSTHDISIKICNLNQRLNSIEQDFKKVKLMGKTLALAKKVDELHQFYGTDTNDKTGYVSNVNTAIKLTVDKYKEEIEDVFDIQEQLISESKFNDAKSSLDNYEEKLNALSLKIDTQNQSPCDLKNVNKNELFATLVNGTKLFLYKSVSEIKQENKSHLINLHHEWHFKNLFRKCIEMKSKINNPDENKFRFSILTEIEGYLKRSGKKTPFYRLVNINEIFTILSEKGNDESLRSALNTYLPEIRNGRLPISNLRYAIYDCIRKFDFNNNEKYFKNRKAAPTA